jgi:hypothetical protein
MSLKIDADVANADWLKRSWDLNIDNVKDLRAFIERNGLTIEKFKKLPVYTANVDALPWLKDL